MDEVEKKPLTPIAVVPKDDKLFIYYRCPVCRNPLVSLWDDEKHKIKRPTECRDCGQPLTWEHADNSQLSVIEVRDEIASNRCEQV